MLTRGRGRITADDVDEFPAPRRRRSLRRRARQHRRRRGGRPRCRRRARSGRHDRRGRRARDDADAGARPAGGDARCGGEGRRAGRCARATWAPSCAASASGSSVSATSAAAWPRSPGRSGWSVSGWNRTPRDVTGVAAPPLDELLAECDVVQVCVALTPDTRHLLDERRLALLAPGAMVVNTRVVPSSTTPRWSRRSPPVASVATRPTCGTPSPRPRPSPPPSPTACCSPPTSPPSPTPPTASCASAPSSPPSRCSAGRTAQPMGKQDRTVLLSPIGCVGQSYSDSNWSA